MKTKLYLALFCVAFFWGTTFLAIRVAVETIPPFILAGIRNLISGTLIFCYLLWQKRLEKISPIQFFRAFIVSILMIVLANGLTTYSEKYISSGLTSLISTLTPFCVLILNLILGFEKLSIKTIGGILSGMSGIFIIYQSGLSDLLIPEYRQGIFALLMAILAWSIGTIVMKRGSQKPLPVLMNASIQMLIAGVLLTTIQLIVTPSLSTETWNIRSIAAMIYLALFGSVIGYVAFSYLLTQLAATKVVVLSYVNVVVALFLGWLILDEVITSRTILATVLIISGVILVNYKKTK